jgi:endonuclease YncB( thermonuclease family)
MTILTALLLASSLPACTVTDGDTIRCADEKIRLIGINAPEMPGHCRRGMDCPPGDGRVSKEKLRSFVEGKRLTIRRFRTKKGKLLTDKYGRTLAVVYADGINIACHQLRTGQALYRRDWDNRGIIRKECL